MRKLQVILGLIMVISVFLPWASVETFGWKTTAAGIDYGYGILVLIMGIFCVGLPFLAEPKIRGIGHLATGIIALIGLAGYWGTVRSEVGMLGEEVSPEFGFILCIIVAIAVIITGISQMVVKSARKEDVMGAGKANLSCPKCGAENKPGAKFCQNCGAPLSKE